MSRHKKDLFGLRFGRYRGVLIFNNVNGVSSAFFYLL